MSLFDDATFVLQPGLWKQGVVAGIKPLGTNSQLAHTRSSDATFTDSTGVVRRSPWNLFTNSEDFDTWTKQQVNVSTNVAANPLTGVVNADLLIPDTTNNNHRIYKIATVPSSSFLSVYLKAAGYNYVSLGKAGGIGGFTIIFNLSNGTVSGSASGFSGTISPAGNGWYLCSLISSGVTNDYASYSNWIVIRDNSTNLVFTGDGTSGVLVANAQLVEGNEPLPYLPTTTRVNFPRIDYANADGSLRTCGALLIEPQRTNSIRNSSMVGAVAGSPGTLPTNWSGGIVAGLTRTIVGTGTENGLPYIDIRYNGTAVSTSVLLKFESLISASSGQSWTPSLYIKGISGTMPTTQLYIFEVNNLGSIVTNSFTTLNYSSSLTRQSFTRTLNNAATVNVDLIYAISLTNGATYDFTIRIAAPQLELGDHSTTWIPTTTSAVTRSEDLILKTGVSSLIGQSTGTLYVEWENANNGLSNLIETYNSASNITGTSSILIQKSDNNQFNIRVFDSAGNYSDTFAVTMPSGRNRVALVYQPGYAALYLNGAFVGSNTRTYTFGSTRDTIGFDNRGSYPRHKVLVFTRALDEIELVALTGGKLYGDPLAAYNAYMVVPENPAALMSNTNSLYNA